jgi:DNA-binding LytR/AlgR family response regulator
MVLSVAAAVFLALTDAFGLDVLPLWARLAYWLVLLFLGQAVVFAVRSLMGRLRLSPANTALATLAVCALASVPVTVLVWLVTAFALSESLDPARLPAFYIPVVVVIAAMAAISFLLQRRPRETHAQSTPGGSTSGIAPIVTRLPLRLKSAAIHAVQAEDHYIRVHTDAGSDLVLMRFADALDALQGIEGAQVHRSWWVARAAVTGACRERGRICLVLNGGTKAPVSRSYVRALRHEGWL